MNVRSRPAETASTCCVTDKDAKATSVFAEDQTGIQQNSYFILAGSALAGLPGGRYTEFSVLKGAESFSQPLIVRHLIAVNITQLALMIQEVLDLPRSRTGEK